MALLDLECQQRVEGSIQVGVPWLLSASYLYYIHDENIISDETYDWLGKHLKAHRASITHPHVRVIPEEFWGSTTSSLMGLKDEDYPSLCKHASFTLLSRTRPKHKGRIITRPAVLVP